MAKNKSISLFDILRERREAKKEKEFKRTHEHCVAMLEGQPNCYSNERSMVALGWNNIPAISEHYLGGNKWFVTGISGLEGVPFDKEAADLIIDAWYKVHPKEKEKRDEIVRSLPKLNIGKDNDGKEETGTEETSKEKNKSPGCS